MSSLGKFANGALEGRRRALNRINQEESGQPDSAHRPSVSTPSSRSSAIADGSDRQMWISSNAIRVEFGGRMESRLSGREYRHIPRRMVIEAIRHKSGGGVAQQRLDAALAGAAVAGHAGSPVRAV